VIVTIVIEGMDVKCLDTGGLLSDDSQQVKIARIRIDE
jgi:hypothetical protein